MLLLVRRAGRREKVRNSGEPGDACWAARRVVRTATAALVMLTAQLGSAPSYADEWGYQDGDTGAHPDENPHTFCFSSTVGADLQYNVREAEYNALRDDTDADVAFVSSCNWDGYQETDGVWRNVDLAGQTTGSTPCQSWENGVVQGQCDQYYINLDGPEIRVGEYDEIDETQTACHELGHAVGLTHGGDDCTISTGPTPPTDPRYRRYGSHHRGDHINVWF